MNATDSENKTRYRVPSVSVDADTSLDEFDESDIVGYLRHLGYTVDGDYEEQNFSSDGGLILSPSDLDRIETLALCGQKEPARQLALQIIGEAIGRLL